MDLLMRKQLEKYFDTPLKEKIELDQNSFILNKGTLSYIQDPIQNKYKQINTDRKALITTVEKSHNKRLIAVGNIFIQYDLAKLNIYSRQKLVKCLRFQCSQIVCKFAIDDVSIYIFLSHPFRILELSILDGFKLIRQNQTRLFDDKDLIILKYPNKNYLVLKQCNKIVIYDLLKDEFNLIIKLKDQIWGFDCLNNLATQIVCSQQDYMLSFYNNKKLEFQQRIEIKDDQFNLHAGLISLKFFGIHNKIAGTTSSDLIIWLLDHDKKCFTQELIIKGNDIFYVLEFCPQIIIIEYFTETLAYKLQTDNQNQISQISLCNRIRLINDLSKYASQTYIIEIIK